MRKKVLGIIILCWFNTLNGHTQFLVKIPTRQRPEQFFKFLDEYYRLKELEDTAFLISCDIDDSSMNNPEIHEKLKNYPNLYVFYSNNTSKIEACNADIDKIEWNVILLTSDDMYPMVKGYDKILLETMQLKYPDYDGVINFNDGAYGDKRLNTCPVVGKTYYNRFKYLYHPAYKSWWVDCEFTIVSKLLKKEYYLPLVLIKHKQFGNGLDTLYAKNAEYAPQDRATFFLRKKNFFNLDSSIVASLTTQDYKILNIYDTW